MKNCKGQNTKAFKVGINATSLSNRPSGAKNRFLSIYSELFSILTDVKFVIYHSSDYEIQNDIKLKPNLIFQNTPFESNKVILRNIKGFFYWKHELARQKFDIFENLHLPSIRNNFGATIQTIHDIRHLNDKTIMSYFYLFVYRYSFSKCDLVFTVSNMMKKEIMKKFSGANVSVIYNSLDKSRYKLNQAIPKNYNNNYILSVGHFELRKNYENLILAFKEVVERGFEEDLILIGNDSGTMKSILALIKNLNLKERVFIFSNIENDELYSLYQHAELFVLPSKYEGFGIPILEAFLFQCPLILSDIPVFRELTEGKLSYFDPDSYHQIANCIVNLLSSRDLARKSIEYGNKRINDFDNHELAFALKQQYEIIAGYSKKLQ